MSRTEIGWYKTPCKDLILESKQNKEIILLHHESSVPVYILKFDVVDD